MNIEVTASSFYLLNTDCSRICASYRSHKEYTKDENNSNETINMFFVTEKKSPPS